MSSESSASNPFASEPGAGVQALEHAAARARAIRSNPDAKHSTPPSETPADTAPPTSSNNDFQLLMLNALTSMNTSNTALAGQLESLARTMANSQTLDRLVSPESKSAMAFISLLPILPANQEAKVQA